VAFNNKDYMTREASSYECTHKGEF